MNKEQIIDEAYKKYADSHWTPPSNPNGKLLSDQLFSVVPMEHSKESFINKCKTDSKFSKNWGLKIEEQELSLGERWSILDKKGYRGLLNSNVKNYKSSKKIFEVIKKTCDELNIPTKLITLTYNNETIESYE